MEKKQKYETFDHINTEDMMPPDGFVYVDRIVDSVTVDLKYRSVDNFTGARVPGYRGTRAILTRPAAYALSRAVQELSRLGLGVLIWDAYRPQRAVDAFVNWASTPCVPERKARFYPNKSKELLFHEGLVASPSAHSRGSTVDLTLVRLRPWRKQRTDPRLPHSPLDMGTCFDFFGSESATSYAKLTRAQTTNRRQLLDVMVECGFNNFPMEWWHFTLAREPFPRTYFNFDVRDDWNKLEDPGGPQ